MTVAASATATTAAARLAYLGPEGTFTHAAALALTAVNHSSIDLHGAAYAIASGAVTSAI